MDNGQWSVTLKPNTPRSFLNGDAASSNYMYATLVVTPLHHDVGAISDSNLLATARFAGVYLEQSDDGYTMKGEGLPWWLGDENNGDMYTGADTSNAAATFSSCITNRVLNFANGMTAGTVDSTTGTLSVVSKAGQTRRQTLDTVCAAFDYEWRVNPDFTLDAGQRFDLFDSNAVIFTQDGGRDGNIVGLRSELSLDSVSGEEYRTDMEVNWNEGVTNGTASNTPPTTWRTPAGTVPVLTSVLDTGQRGKIRGRRTIAKIAAWILKNQNRASVVAQHEANQVNSYEYQITAEVDEYDPLRFFSVGDTAYVYDLNRGIVDTGNEVYYRGSALHPQQIRIVSVEWPFQEGMGVYLVRYFGDGGSNRSILDLTPRVLFEESTTTVTLSTNVRYHKRNAQRTGAHRRRIARHAAAIIHRNDLLSQLTFGRHRR